MRLLEDICTVVPTEDKVATVETEIRDPKDMHVIAAALFSGTEVIVTGDKDLLSLEDTSLLIINAADFNALISRPS